MKYLIIFILLAQGCATPADKDNRRGKAMELCNIVYEYSGSVAVRQIEGGQILIYCGEKP